MSDYQIAFLILTAAVALVGGVASLLVWWDEILDFIQAHIRPHPWYAIGVRAYFVLFLLLGLC